MFGEMPGVGFGKLGSLYHPEIEGGGGPGPGLDDALLLEDNVSYLLLEDGTSRLLLG